MSRTLEKNGTIGRVDIQSIYDMMGQLSHQDNGGIFGRHRRVAVVDGVWPPGVVRSFLANHRPIRRRCVSQIDYIQLLNVSSFLEGTGKVIADRISRECVVNGFNCD